MSGAAILSHGMRACYLPLATGLVLVGQRLHALDVRGRARSRRRPEAMTLAEISRLIRIAGREPVERDTFCNVVSLPA